MCPYITEREVYLCVCQQKGNKAVPATLVVLPGGYIYLYYLNSQQNSRQWPYTSYSIITWPLRHHTWLALLSQDSELLSLLCWLFLCPITKHYCDPGLIRHLFVIFYTSFLGDFIQSCSSKFTYKWLTKLYFWSWVITLGGYYVLG